MLQSATVIQVYYLGAAKKQLMGRLAFKNRKIFFEYSSEFLSTKLELSPFNLPLSRGVIACDDYLFQGLFGVFNDSLPDGWGRLLLDRKLIKLGINANALTPLDRLRYVGNQGMGALAYEPDMEESTAIFPQHNLDEIAEEILQFQDHDKDQFVDELLAMNGSSGGVRPKIMIKLENNTSVDNHWIIKFRSSFDPKDIGTIEYAYHLMAKNAGLNVPDACLFPSKKGPGYFGVKRFDRAGEKRIHMHTMSGLLQIDHRVPSLDYALLMKATLRLTQDIREGEKQFRQAVFNVFTHNRDDHAKNFSYLMDETGRWQISPAYDLTFSSGPAGEHCTTLMGEGRNIELHQVLNLAELVGIKKTTALAIIDEIRSTTAKWHDFAEQAGVSKTASNMIQTAFNRVDKNFFIK